MITLTWRNLPDDMGGREESKTFDSVAAARKWSDELSSYRLRLMVNDAVHNLPLTIFKVTLSDRGGFPWVTVEY